MTASFKKIAITIILLLFIMFLFQIFSIVNIYKTLDQQLERSIVECLEKADLDELQHRVDSMDNVSNKEREYVISKGFGVDDSKGFVFKDQRNYVEAGDTILMGETVEKTSLNIINQMGFLIREGLHQVMDSLTSPNMNVFRSSIEEYFEEKNIKAEIYKIERVRLKNDSVISQLVTLKSRDKGRDYEWVYDNVNQLAYRIYTDSLTKSILYQMLATFVSTFLIFSFLVLSFGYLFRTVYRLKTLEEMKDDFTNNMTHELKTPIAVAYSATDALLNFSQGDSKERREKYLSICKEQLEKLSGLVEQILSMSMERRLKLILKKEYIELKGLFEGLVERHKMSSGKDVTFILNIKPSSLSVLADKTHLNNVLSNLIDNATKYSNDKVQINITAYRDDNFYMIKVGDNGQGIASDKQKFIFDKFYRVSHGNKHEVKGYGIGLYYVKTIVEKHGGSISVSSILGKGSEFTIKIPVE